MPALTPCAALPYPVPSDPPDVAGDMKRLAEAVDAKFCGNSGKSVGEIFTFWDMGKGYPPDALVCDGSTFSPTTWPELNAYLEGNQLPDLRGRFLMGANASYPVRTFGGFANSVNVEHDHAMANHSHSMTHNHTTSVGSQSASHTHGTKFADGYDVGSADRLGLSSALVGGIQVTFVSRPTAILATDASKADLNTDNQSASHVHAVTVNNSTVTTGFVGALLRTSSEGSDGAERNRPPFATVTYLIQAR